MSEPRLTAATEVAFRQLGDECILVPIRRSPDAKLSVLSLNPVAAFIWQRLQLGASLLELAEGVVAEFDVERSVAQHDAREFVDELARRGLVSGGTRC